MTTRTRSAVVILVAAFLMVGVVMAFGGGSAGSAAPDSLPATAESARAAAVLDELPGGDTVPAVAVIARDSGPLTPQDRAWITQLTDTWAAKVDGQITPAGTSPDGRAVLLQIPFSDQVSGLDLTDSVEALRKAVPTPPEGVSVELTGGAAFAGDLSSAFAGADVQLLLVTAAVVALLLIITYRSPVLWLVPLLVIAIADRTSMVLNERIGELLDSPLDGSTSGITSVLVFGAGANYALLLVSRYREELRHTEDSRAALASAVRGAVPAILASNLTVVLSMLVLLLAVQPNARSLGLAAAVGLALALLFGIFVLPAALALFGRGLFWPFVPQPGKGSEKPGAWRRVAEWVVAHAKVVLPATLIGLVLLSFGLSGLSLGLSTTDKFRVEAESVRGLETIEKHFPSGSSDPVQVLSTPAAAAQVAEIAQASAGVDSVRPVPPEPDARWALTLVTLDAAPGTDASIEAVRGLRDRLDRTPDTARTLVGGSVAEDVDARAAAKHDLVLVIPLILLVVLTLLIILLRSLVAPVLLLLSTLISTAAAFGLGVWVSTHVFGFPALDVTTPLYVFLFLVALGIDYTIFLVVRAREQARTSGSVRGMVEAVGHTGAVITSAGVVLAAVFAVLGVLPLITLTQIGIIVGLGILLDTFVVRTLVVPAIFDLLGDKVWWPSKFPHDKAHSEPAAQGQP